MAATKQRSFDWETNMAGFLKGGGMNEGRAGLSGNIGQVADQIDESLSSSCCAARTVHSASDAVARLVDFGSESAVLRGIQMAKMLQIVPDKCTGCMQCELACSWVQTGTFQPSQSLIRVNVFDEQASYAPLACIQCDEAWCMNTCPTNAIAIDPDTGAKVVMDQLCIGCHLCTITCPFGTVWTLPENDKAAKCNLCGGDPACVTSCPTDAIEFLDSNDAGPWFESWGEKVTAGYVAAQD